MIFVGDRARLSRRLFVGGAAALTTEISSLSRIGAAAAADTKPDFEIVPLTAEDMGLAPPQFIQNGRPAPLTGSWNYGHVQVAPNTPPIYFSRSWFPIDGAKPLGLEQLTDNVMTQSKALHCGETYEGPVTLKETAGDPQWHGKDRVTYELQGTGPGPKLRLLYSSKRARLIEENVLDLTWTFPPYALVFNRHPVYACPYFIQAAPIEGTVDGQKVSGWGGIQTLYDKSLAAALQTKVFAGMSFAGTSPDGKREWGYVFIIDDVGFGYYCRDGHDPVVSQDVKFASNWQPTPWGKETMSFTRASWSFAGKIINFEATYGWSGQSGCVKRRPGFSLGSGVWWEGTTRRAMFPQLTWTECHNATDGAKLPGSSI